MATDLYEYSILLLCVSRGRSHEGAGGPGAHPAGDVNGALSRRYRAGPPRVIVRAPQHPQHSMAPRCVLSAPLRRCCARRRALSRAATLQVKCAGLQADRGRLRATVHTNWPGNRRQRAQQLAQWCRTVTAVARRLKHTRPARHPEATCLHNACSVCTARGCPAFPDDPDHNPTRCGVAWSARLPSSSLQSCCNCPPAESGLPRCGRRTRVYRRASVVSDTSVMIFGRAALTTSNKGWLCTLRRGGAPM